MNKLTFSVLSLLTASPLLAQEHGDAQWHDDFDAAVAAAKKANKDLLVDFTGSDWCGWCIKLHKEVFDHEEFQQGVEDHFVLVALDFPRGDEAKAKVPNPERNKELQQKYGVRGFPTILLMSADGEVYGKTGYQAGGPVKYVESLDKMRTEGKRNVVAIKEMVAKFEAAKGPTQDAAMAMAIDMLATLDSGQVGIDQLAAVVKNGVDSQDAAVQERAVTALLKAGQGDDACLAKAAELDPKNEKGLYEYVVKGKMASVNSDEAAKAFLTALDELLEMGAKDQELLEGMLANAARWSFGPLKNKEGAVKYAKLLKTTAKDVEKHSQLLSQILGDGN